LGKQITSKLIDGQAQGLAEVDGIERVYGWDGDQGAKRDPRDPSVRAATAGAVHFRDGDIEEKWAAWEYRWAAWRRRHGLSGAIRGVQEGRLEWDPEGSSERASK
jgi:hypothetical protein